MFLRHRISGFRNVVYQTAAGIIVGSVWVPRHHNVLALVHEDDDPRATLHAGHNIVTNDGDEYYAEKGAGEAASTDFTAGGMRLGTASTSPTKTSTDVTTFIASSGKSVTSGYPKSNDDDTDNTTAAADKVSWQYSWAKGDFNDGAIAEGAIVDNTTTPTKALTHFLFGSAFEKTANDTLKVIVNHEMSGQ